MAWCSLRALSTPDTSKTISTYLDCKDVLAARRTCHLMEPLPRCLPNLLPGQRCPCFWRSPEWFINKSTKVPHTVLRWPIARACDNLVGPIYPPHKWAFDIALRRRLRFGLWPRVRSNCGSNGWTDQLETSTEVTDYWENRMIEFSEEISAWARIYPKVQTEHRALVEQMFN
jgi:hypothetical protein